MTVLAEKFKVFKKLLEIITIQVELWRCGIKIWTDKETWRSYEPPLMNVARSLRLKTDKKQSRIFVGGQQSKLRELVERKSR